jgi:hypothetical protein
MKRARAQTVGRPALAAILRGLARHMGQDLGRRNDAKLTAAAAATRANGTFTRRPEQGAIKPADWLSSPTVFRGS